MHEIEIKVLGIDVDFLMEQLEKLGAKKVFSGLVKCVQFDREGRPIRSSGSLFRLRRWEGDRGFSSKFEICFKGPKRVVDGCKVRQEIETTVSDADRFESMLRALGYQITLDNEKRRVSYEFGLTHIDIDFYPRSPVYIEIEGPDRAAIDHVLKQLKLTVYEQSTESAEELFERLWPEVDFEHLKF